MESLPEYLFISSVFALASVFLKVRIKRLRYPHMKSVVVGLALGWASFALALILNIAYPVLSREGVALIAFLYTYYMADSQLVRDWM